MTKLYRIKQKNVKCAWSEEEDIILSSAVAQFGDKGWTQVAGHLPGRIGKQCRDRWFNHLQPHLKREPWSPLEDQILFSAQKQLGNSWSKIAKLYLPGRTDLSVKNRFYSFKRRMERQRAAGVCKKRTISGEGEMDLKYNELKNRQIELSRKAENVLQEYQRETLKLHFQINQIMSNVLLVTQVSKN
eukprot:snap_masked-scaffold_27-processed-gene-1.53-mRNA-1 protein AED:0.03 eAED:0.03 QI:0/0/0/0.5/1/1/2/0/186